VGPHAELGDVARSDEMIWEVLARARVLGNRGLEAQSLGALAEHRLDAGNLDEGLPLLEESTRIYREIDNPPFIGVNLCRYARALAIVEKPAPAAEVLARALGLYEEIGAGVDPWLAKYNEETRELIRAELDDDSYAAACERGRELTVEGAVELALEALA
jgi:hypothetical protein